MSTTPKNLKALEIINKISENRLERRQKEHAHAVKKPPVQMMLMLPLLQCDERLMPNALARAAIFNATKSGDTLDRQFYSNRVVASFSNMKIMYRGSEMKQDDASVFIALLFFQAEYVLGEPIKFSAYEMLQELGWSINKREYEHLRECCGRLSATNITISFNDGSEGYAGSLVRDFVWADSNDKTLSQWAVRLEPNIARFFQEDSYSIIDPKIRREISGRAPLAQWLHSFFSTHKEPIPISVAKYHELTNSSSKCTWDFENRMNRALQKLVECKFLVSFEIKNHMVHVQRVKILRKAPVQRPGNVAGNVALSLAN